MSVIKEPYVRSRYLYFLFPLLGGIIHGWWSLGALGGPKEKKFLCLLVDVDDLL
jgi:hypothetical protein